MCPLNKLRKANLRDAQSSLLYLSFPYFETRKTIHLYTNKNVFRDYVASYLDTPLLGSWRGYQENILIRFGGGALFYVVRAIVR